MLTCDSVHIYPSNMKWETRIKKITSSLIKMNLQNKILIVGFNDCYNSKIYRENSNIIIWLHKRRNIFFNETINKIFNFILLYIEVIFRLKKINFNYINPHSISVLPLAVILKFFKKKITLVYDTHELETEVSEMSLIRKCISKLLEKLCLNFTDKIVVVSSSIEIWYKNKYNFNNIYTIRNFPIKIQNFSNYKSNYLDQFKINKNKILFCYHGLLSTARDVQTLANFFKNNPDCGQILFIGFGELTDLIKNYSLKYNNIFYSQPLKLNELFSCLIKVDIVFSLFKFRSLNEVYSLPNKMFEAINVGTPVIVNSGGEAANFIKTFNIGWEIKSIENDLKVLISSITKEDLKSKSKNAIVASKNLNWETEKKILKEIYN